MGAQYNWMKEGAISRLMSFQWRFTTARLVRVVGALLAAGLLAATAHGVTFPDKPPTTDFFVDKAQLISEKDRKAVNDIAGKLLQEQRIPLFVVTVSSLAAQEAANYSIENYAEGVVASAAAPRAAAGRPVPGDEASMRKASQFFSEDDRRAIEQVVAAAEARTAAEIIPVVATGSGRYDRAEDLFGIMFALVALAAAWLGFQNMGTPGGWAGGHEPALSLVSILLIVFFGFVAGTALAHRGA